MSVSPGTILTSPAENPSAAEPQERPSDMSPQPSVQKNDESPSSPSSIVTLNRNSTAVDYNANRDQNILQALSAQLEYYFSSQNLSKDTFLRSKMAQYKGYAPVELVAGFNYVIKILLRMGGRRQLLDSRKENRLQLRCEWLIEAAALSTKLQVVPLETDNEGNAVAWGVGPKCEDSEEIKREPEINAFSELVSMNLSFLINRSVFCTACFNFN